MDREERIEELEGDLPSELAEKLIGAEDEIEAWKAKVNQLVRRVAELEERPLW